LRICAGLLTVRLAFQSRYSRAREYLEPPGALKLRCNMMDEVGPELFRTTKLEFRNLNSDLVGARFTIWVVKSGVSGANRSPASRDWLG
jgi:hypothetical protein